MTTFVLVLLFIDPETCMQTQTPKTAQENGEATD